MNDQDVLSHIDQLVAEEHELLNKNGLSESEQARLHALQVSLDQCWDLLRQRRGRREFGQDPDEANVRDAGTVERYRQ
ncbi:MAG: DUF2630 family protein [Dehalococcoidia bacterium]